MRRQQRDQVPFRKLYHLIYNCNSAKGKGLTSQGMLREWPLKLIDNDQKSESITLEYAEMKMKKAIENNKRMKAAKNGGIKDNNK
jgi:hypothetical protein